MRPSPWYTPIQILSIDVVLGALLTGNMGAKLLEIDMPWSWWVVFPVSIWVFYTGDHLLDAYRLGSKAHTLRHQFHFRYFSILCGVVLGLLLLVGVVSFFAPSPLLRLGFFLGCLGIVHLGLSFVLQNTISKWLQKELGVALIYTLGVWGGPAMLYPDNLPIPYLVIACQFFFLALINLLLFSLYEIETDTLDGHTSFVRAIGKESAKRWVMGISFAICLLTFWLIPRIWPDYKWLFSQGISLGIGTIFLFILFFPNWFKEKNRYRFWGDGAFLMSALYHLKNYL